MRFLLGERVRESYESRAGKRCGKTKSVAAIRKRKKGTKIPAAPWKIRTRRVRKNSSTAGQNRIFI